MYPEGLQWHNHTPLSGHLVVTFPPPPFPLPLQLSLLFPFHDHTPRLSGKTQGNRHREGTCLPLPLSGAKPVPCTAWLKWGSNGYGVSPAPEAAKTVRIVAAGGSGGGMGGEGLCYWAQRGGSGRRGEFLPDSVEGEGSVGSWDVATPAGPQIPAVLFQCPPFTKPCICPYLQP